MCQNASKNILTFSEIGLNALLAALEITNPGDPNLVKYKADVTTLLGQLATFQTTGGTIAVIVEILGDVEADINLFPITTQNQELIVVALAGVQSILAYIQATSASGGATKAAVEKIVGTQQIDPVYYGKLAFVRWATDWNSAIKERPALKAAEIKDKRVVVAQLFG